MTPDDMDWFKRFHDICHETLILSEYEDQLSGRPTWRERLRAGSHLDVSEAIEHHKRLGEQVAQDVENPYERTILQSIRRHQ